MDNNIPKEVAIHFYDFYVRSRMPTYLQVNAQGNLVHWYGHPEYYGLPNLTVGKSVIEQLPFLEGLFPIEQPEILEFVTIGDSKKSTHVHIMLVEDNTWLLFIDASIEREYQRVIKQKTFEQSLLNYRHNQLIQKLELTQQTLLKVNQELQNLAVLDGLTQVSNRRRLDDYLQEIWRRLTTEHAVISFIMCDVDYFKYYNDTYGHQAGDRCLQQIAQAISRVVKRTEDLVARYGGEEFAIVLPHTDSEGASHVALAIQEEVNRLMIEHEASLISDQVTLSIGIASTTLTPKRHIASAVLINLADTALYKAKAQGRNQIVKQTLETYSV